MLVLEPIFEADFPSEIYAYRAGRNAQQAVVEVEEPFGSTAFEIVHGDDNAAFASFRVGASYLNLTVLSWPGGIGPGGEE
jgi:hypothetical protein